MRFSFSFCRSYDRRARPDLLFEGAGRRGQGAGGGRREDTTCALRPAPFLPAVAFCGQKWPLVVERLANKVKFGGGQRTDGPCARQGRRQGSSQNPRRLSEGH